MFSLSTAMVPLAAQAPEGWRVRIDRSENASDPDDVPDLKVAAIGKGFRATGGPAGTFWNPANRVTGNYTARATFNLMKPSGHVNYYGLVFGGSDLEGAAQKFVYFMVAQNGTFIIRGRGCPLSALTGKHRAVCGAMESLVEALVGAPVHEGCDRTGRPLCCFEISKGATTRPAR